MRNYKGYISRNGRATCLILLFLTCGMNMSAQYSMGNTGLMNIPTADMQETGTFMGGGSYLPDGLTPFKYNTGNYFVGITLFSFMELTYRETLLKSYQYGANGKYKEQDRSMSVRIRPLKEGRYSPAVVIGTNDPFHDKGDNYFASVYGVATKSFSLAKGDRLAVSIGGFVPLNKHSVQKGVFGGVSYSPAFCRELLVTAEYDSEGLNVGAAARLWKHVSVHVFTREFNCISGGIRYECTLIH